VKQTKADVSGASTERTKGGGERAPEISLGQLLVAAREKRGLSREEAIKQTRIPAHYLKMLESNDCSVISDPLYLLPFLRKYTTFLELDPEETAMRFVREVQRAENSPSARIDTSLEPRRRKRRNWSGIAMVTLLLAVIAVAYLAESRYRESADNAAPAALSAATVAPATIVAPATTVAPATIVAPGAAAGTAQPETVTAPSTSGVATGASQNPATNAIGQKSRPYPR
jgi:cytoskeletal protein RodZ